MRPVTRQHAAGNYPFKFVCVKMTIMKYFYYTGILFIIIILILSVSSSFALTPGTLYHVTQVSDGNTISIRVTSFAGIPLKVERVRLIGSDAPELKQGPWGRPAKRQLRKLIGENCWVVNVEFDLQQRDSNGRLLAYLWNKKGELINEKLLEEGYAVLYTLPANVKYIDRLAAAQKRAESARAGIWKNGGLKEPPKQWRSAHLRN